MLKILILFFSLLIPLHSFAVVETVVAGATVAKEILGAVNEAGEFLEIFDAFEELVDEVDSETSEQMEAQARQSQQRMDEIREIEEELMETPYALEEWEQQSHTPAENLADRIRKITYTIKTGKKITGAIKKLSNRAQAAQVKTEHTNDKMLRELQVQNQLETDRALRERRLVLEEIRAEKEYFEDMEDFFTAQGIQATRGGIVIGKKPKKPKKRNRRKRERVVYGPHPLNYGPHLPEKSHQKKETVTLDKNYRVGSSYLKKVVFSVYREEFVTFYLHMITVCGVFWKILSFSVGMSSALPGLGKAFLLSAGLFFYYEDFIMWVTYLVESFNDSLLDYIKPDPVSFDSPKVVFKLMGMSLKMLLGMILYTLAELIVLVTTGCLGILVILFPFFFLIDLWFGFSILTRPIAGLMAVCFAMTPIVNLMGFFVGAAFSHLGNGSGFLETFNFFLMSILNLFASLGCFLFLGSQTGIVGAATTAGMGMKAAFLPTLARAGITGMGAMTQGMDWMKQKISPSVATASSAGTSTHQPAHYPSLNQSSSLSEQINQVTEKNPLGFENRWKHHPQKGNNV